MLVIVNGAVEYLDDAGNVTQRYDAARIDALYRRHCTASASAALDRAGEAG